MPSTVNEQTDCNAIYSGIIRAARKASAKLRAQRQPRSVFLFSGHMIDAPGRPEPRFPKALEPSAARAISNILDALDAGPEDLAFSSGACGGDILFAEACLQRGMRLEMLLPFDIPAFVENSVSFAGKGWRSRFDAIRKNPLTSILTVSREPGPPSGEISPYIRVNLWLLHSAFAWGGEKVRFICLWNRQGGDGAGGTEHMYQEVSKRAGQVYLLDTNSIFSRP